MAMFSSTTSLCTEVKQIITNVIRTRVAQVSPVRTFRRCMLVSPSMKAVPRIPILLASAAVTFFFSRFFTVGLIAAASLFFCLGVVLILSVTWVRMTSGLALVALAAGWGAAGCNLIRDERMQSLVAKEKEPITPLIDTIRALYDERGVSSILVMGGSGDYFDVADTVIMLDQYRPHDVTAEAKRVAADHPT